MEPAFEASIECTGSLGWRRSVSLRDDIGAPLSISCDDKDRFGDGGVHDRAVRASEGLGVLEKRTGLQHGRVALAAHLCAVAALCVGDTASPAI